MNNIFEKKYCFSNFPIFETPLQKLFLKLQVKYLPIFLCITDRISYSKAFTTFAFTTQKTGSKIPFHVFSHLEVLKEDKFKNGEKLVVFFTQSRTKQQSEFPRCPKTNPHRGIN